MEKDIEVAFRDVESIIRSVFRGAKSRRTVKIRKSSNRHINNAWDGGARNTSYFIRLGTLQSLSLQDVGFVMQERGNPYKQIVGDVIMTNDIACIENVVFQGKDLGYSIYVSPDVFNKLTADNVGEVLTSTPA